MFILIENHTDEIDTTCRLVGTYESKGMAQTVMHQRYADAHELNEGEGEVDYLEENEARAWWPNNNDFYDWTVFGIKED